LDGEEYIDTFDTTQSVSVEQITWGTPTFDEPLMWTGDPSDAQQFTVTGKVELVRADGARATLTIDVFGMVVKGQPVMVDGAGVVGNDGTWSDSVLDSPT